MPKLDGTGPSGKGPKTGRGLGNCKDIEESKIQDKGSDRRPLDGRGQGRGFGRRTSNRNNS